MRRKQSWLRRIINSHILSLAVGLSGFGMVAYDHKDFPKAESEEIKKEPSYLTWLGLTLMSSSIIASGFIEYKNQVREKDQYRERIKHNNS